MAYVLGYIFSDGSLEDAPSIRGKYVRISSTDKDRIDLIKKALNSKHTITRWKKSARYKEQFLLRIGSHALYDSLIRRGVTPRKSLTMRFPSVPRAYFSYFVLGYFDGDGCASLEAAHSSRPRRLKTIFTSGSRVFLEVLKERLESESNIRGGGIYAHGSSTGTYQLRFTARDSIRLFLLLYRDQKSVSLALKRKYGIFMTYFKRLGLRRKDLTAILRKKGPVVKG